MTILFGCAFALGACGPTYSGPGLTQVMNGTCESEVTMQGLYQCVDKYWAQPISVEAGSQTRVAQRMGEGQKLLQDVQQGRTKNETAMAHWRSLALAEQQRSLAAAEALGGLADSLQSAGTSMQRSAESMSPSRPVNCRTSSYGGSSSYTTCY